MKLLLQARIRGCDGQSRRSALRHTARVCLRASRLRVPVSLRVCTLSRRTFMNNAGSQDAEKVRQPVLFIWSVRSVWFVWLNETHQINRQTGLVPDVQTIEILLCRKG